MTPPDAYARASLAILIAARHDISHRRHDRLNALQDCLRSVCASVTSYLTDPIRLWEHVRIVVIDDHSPVSLRSLLVGVSPLRVEVLRSCRVPGQAGALNDGLRRVAASHYAFTDSDCVVHVDWVSQLSQVYAAYPRCAGVAGPNWLFLQTNGWWRKYLTEQESRLTRHVFTAYLDQRRGTTTRIDCRNLSLSSAFIRAHFPEMVVFQEHSGPSVSGQTSLLMRRLLEGKSLMIAFAPHALTYHQPVLSLWSQLKAYYQRGRLGKFDVWYRQPGGSLWRAFVRRHFVRHFIDPWINGNCTLVYAVGMHVAFWMGIWLASLARLNRAKIAGGSGS